MQGLLARLNQQKNPAMGSKGTSRSASIVSSIDGDEEPNQDQQSDEDESSQSPQTPNTLKPKVRDKKVDIIKANREALKEVKPKKPASKIDTGMSTMVKLKLLDASRKALVDKKKNQVNAYVQTDTFKTKLCKDVSIECQNDLACPVDKSTETEIELLATKAKDGTLIITSTRAMNTDEVPTESVGIQTAMPRSNVAFKRILEEKHKIQYNEEDDDDSNDDDSDYATQELINIERRMRAKAKARIKSQQSIDIVVEDETSDIIAIETIPTESPKKTDVESEFEDSMNEDSPTDNEKQKPKRSKQGSSTLNSWHDLNASNGKVELPQSYFSDGPTPWSSYQDLVLGQRFLNARMSGDQRYSNQMKSVAWSDTQLKIVGDLMREANALMEMFDQVSMLLGPDIKLHKVSDATDFVLPTNKLDGEMSASCDKLEASLKRLQDMKAPRNAAS